MKIPIIRPSVRFDDVAADIRTVLDSGILTNGPFLAQFEAELAAAVGVRHAVATTSATTAMHLVLAAAEIGPGDEVLVSDFTFPATGNVVVERGAVPVLVDCEPGGFRLDLDDADRRVTAKTKALLVVDPFGQPAMSTELLEWAAARRLLVIEDAACALGSSREGVACGAWPEAPGCFSFHPRKVVTTGEGGAVTTDDDEFAARLRLLRSHGGAPGPAIGLSFVAHGFNYRMSELQAVLGLDQLRRLDAIRADRQATAARYEKRLGAIQSVGLVTPPAGEEWSYQSFVVLVDERDDIVTALRDLGIETTLGTYALHAQPVFGPLGYAPGDLPESFDRQQRSLTLPLLPEMTSEQVDEVIAAISAIIGARRA
ncbi:MAG: DegT/DnrJ/EryC1/StrS family aminotransferase [Actinobacteria bacterium]|nr:DegT/DnrJ/EryC1/StrS family aminotransferase [Actinomycetota bacterium]